MNDLKNTYHRDGSVTFWNVLTQSWQRKNANDIPAAILASMTPAERRRIEIMANPRGFECNVFGSGPYLKGRFPSAVYRTRSDAEAAISRWLSRQDQSAPMAAHKTWVSAK